MKEHLNSLFFTAVVIFSVLLGGIRQESAEEAVLEQKPESTSFAAVVKTVPLSDEPQILPPNLSATAVLVGDWSVVNPIFHKNLDQQWPIASLTKLMTAVVAVENIQEEEKISMSSNAIATEGNAGNFLVGGSYSLNEALKALLKFSSNDAAVAVAEHFGYENFVVAMNGKLKELGMNNTRFFDPTGLSPLNQSTSGDLEKLAMYIFYSHPHIFEITREKEGNIHPFAGQENFLGGKTGFIDEANGNLISLFNPPSGGGPLLIIVLGSEDRFLDTKILYDRFTSR